MYLIHILYTGIYIVIIKSTNYYGSYGPFSTLKNGFSFDIFVKDYGIGFIYRPVYNHKI